MKAVIGLLLMLVRVSLGVETFCDGRQNQAQCYGALGGTVDIRLMDKVPESPRFELSNSNRKIVRWTGNGSVKLKLERLEFTSNNGIMRINNLNPTDVGEYKIELFEDGKITVWRTLQLNIQAPVSSVQLKSECLSQGVKRMSCSSEGDSPQFSWTLDGDTLRDDQLLSGNAETREITLKTPVSGELVCTVRNHISRASASLMTPTSETFCDGRQNQAQCYGALGGTVDIRLMDKVPERQRFELSKSNKNIVRWTGKGTVRVSFERSEFTSNSGTMRINNLIKTDDGEYKLELYNEDGNRTDLRTLQLTVQAPVSSVQLNYDCLSQDEKRMSCSSEGDSPQLSWTLDGDTLRDDQLLSGNNGTHEITLRAPVLGELVCTARNHISRASATLMIPTCETFCNGRQNQAQCYGALGGTVVIRLMDKVPERLRFELSKSNKIIVRWNKNWPVTLRLERIEFTSNNGTVRINNLNRTDDGEYKIELFEDGRRTAVRTLQLNIQAPVSSVQLKSECLSQGVKRMSCSSEGYSPQFSWTLDGDTLRDDQLLSGNAETREITLRAPVSGELVCTVRNRVSRASASLMTPICGYIFIQCQLSNGTNITQWVFEANNTLCINSTTTITTTTITSDNVGKKSDITGSNNPSTTFTSSNQTSLSIDKVLLTLFLRALVVTIIFSGIVLYFTWKKKKKTSCEKTVASDIHYRKENEDNSVIMVEMRKD